jgi:Chalcone isomerase-like
MWRPPERDARPCQGPRRTLVLGVAGMLTSAVCAQLPPGPDTSGVEFAETLRVRGETLRLNGAGTRYKFIVRVYAAALYAPEPVTSVEAAIEPSRPRLFRVVMLRDIDGSELGRLLLTGVQKNATREEQNRSLTGMLRLGEVFAEYKRLVKNDEFSIEWAPREGTVISINGVRIGAPLAEPAFFSALMKIWLGPVPADATLKQALLQGSAR